MTIRERRTNMRRVSATLALCIALVGCGRAGDPSGDGPVELEAVLADPEAFAGERLEIRAGYYSSFEVSALTTGFAESFPPQPVEPLVWVNAFPPSDCLEVVERASWAERVVAAGVLETGGGFGHLGQYRFQLTDATIRCA